MNPVDFAPMGFGLSLMPHQQRSRVVVMLSELDPKKCAYYMPREGETLRFPQDDSGKEITVALVSSKPNKAWFVVCPVHHSSVIRFFIFIQVRLSRQSIDTTAVSWVSKPRV